MRLLLVMIFISSTLDFSSGSGGTSTCDGRLRVFIDFAAYNSLKKAVVYNCGSISEQRRILLELAKAGMSAILFNLESDEDVKTEKFFDYKERIGVFVNLDCEHVVQALKIIPEGFSHTTWWAAFTNHVPSVLNTLLSLPLTLNSQILLMVRDDATWHAYDVYTMDYRKPSPLNITFYGLYSERQHQNTSLSQKAITTYPPSLILNRNTSYDFQELDQKYQEFREGVKRSLEGVRNGRKGWWSVLVETKVRRRRDFHNAMLTGAYAVNDKPRYLIAEKYLDSEKDLHLDSHPRYTILLVRYMQQMYRFQVKLIRASEWAGQRNGTWVGIAGALLHGIADLGTSPMAVKRARLQVIEFSGLIVTTKYPTVFRQPKTAGSVRLSAFTAPLADAAWGTALPLCVLAVILIAFTARLETRYVGSPDNYTFDLGAMLLDLVNIFYLDASWRESRLWSARATCLTACILGLLLMQFYSASLLATVLAPPPKSISSLQDLLRTDMQYKVEDVVYQRQFFKENMEIPDVKRLYNTKVIKGDIPPFLVNDEGLKLVKEGNFAFQCTSTYAYRVLSSWSDELICSLDELLVFPLLQQYFTVARGSPYRQHVLVALLTIRERGVAARARSGYYQPRPRCPPDHAAAPRPVALPQFQPALLMLATLGAVSVGILLIELAVYHFANRQKRRRTTRKFFW